ncbi:hypothetical protein [Neosynechococcus sphagnicola]|uniref:hypothetical protein n=1 Tax=Neosynechococcus sphagnicola TaxID=1501145 RepID=UPI00068A6EC6|nr:hypothetical protein [Neosynechococcus sphagnicola]
MDNLTQLSDQPNAVDQFQIPGLPLAVYRELAAHLQQVVGVSVVLVPQSSEQFDYSQSQVASLQIEYAITANPIARCQVEPILAYYRDHYAGE